MAMKNTHCHLSERDTDIELERELSKVEDELQATLVELNTILERQQRLQEKKRLLKQQQKSLKESEKKDFNASSKSFPWSEQLFEKLKSVFHVEELRPLQLETMNTTLSGQDCFLIMPTGGGKSLCYQLPAIISAGLTVVISPLISLMEDQMMTLKSLGIFATMLSASTSKELVNATLQDMTSSKCKLKLLYVTPEKIAKSKRFMSKLEKCNAIGSLSRIAIDEVHCCSQWGHDFRPDYKILGILKRQFPTVPILGLTATASSDTLADVKKILNVPYAQVWKASFNRPNLFYNVITKPAVHKDCIDLITNRIKSDYCGHSGIVYTFSRKDTEIIAKDLSAAGVKCAAYHADLLPEERSKVHCWWSQNKIQVIVATIAFGMGIDKPDVRFVIHHSLSKSMENYYQESGRAGRNCQRADCVLLFRLTDVFRQSCMVFTEQTGLTKLYKMVEYCLNFSQCRRVLIAEHFSKVWQTLSCNEMCDFCSGKTEAVANQFTDIDISSVCNSAIEVLNKAKSKDVRVTALKLLDAMQGKGPANIRPTKCVSITGDGCQRVVGFMLAKGFLREDFHFTPYSTISYLLPGLPVPTHLYIHTSKQKSSSISAIDDKPNNSENQRKKRKRAHTSTRDTPAMSDEVIVLDSE